ncbi:MAG: transposase [Candidatus Competibacteraceae bacterium]|nr:transposase [Candidatus Competibacteraceae bacterium]
MNEAGLDDNEDCAWGWSPKGQRCIALKSGHRRERMSVIAALDQGQWLAPMVFMGDCDRAVFTAWLERFLVPVLKPGQTVLLDNARFHQEPTFSKTLAKVGHALRCLPPTRLISIPSKIAGERSKTKSAKISPMPLPFSKPSVAPIT